MFARTSEVRIALFSQLHPTMHVATSPLTAEGVAIGGAPKKKKRFKIMTKLMKGRGHKDKSPGPTGKIYTRSFSCRAQTRV